jgi:hypothetical protein
LLAPYDVFGAPKTSSGAVQQTADPVVLFERLYAFPRSKRTTGSVARDCTSGYFLPPRKTDQRN